MEPHLNSYPHKEKMKKRLTEMWDYPKYGCPYRKGPRYFYSYNTGLQNHSVVYVQDSLDGEARVFLDPNTLSDDGTVAVAGKSFTKDGSMCAVALTASGSDWNTIKFMNVGTCEFMEDVLKKVKFSCRTWTRDNKGIFYNSYPHAEDHHEGKETTSNTHHSLYYHVMGTPQEQDVLCAEFPDQPNWMSGVQVSDCGNYLLLSISDGCDPVNRLYYSDLRTLSNGIDGILPWVKLIDNFDAEYDYITNEGTVFTFKSNLNAPKYKIINIDFSRSEPIECKDLIPEEEDTLEDAICVNGKDLIVLYMHKVKHVMYACDLITGEKKYTFPLEIGSVAGITGRKEDVEIFYYFTSFLVPGTIFRCDMTADVLQPEIFREVKVQGVDTSLYDSDQVFYKSKDGTEIPMFLIKRKDVELNGENPLLLYGYGGFNVSLTPYFSNSRLFFVERFGVYAIANIRGGGEFGETWHKAGSFGWKQNVFDDFIAAAEYLIENKYTNSNKIVINGGSNGGLLVGACSNQRPDLFKVAVADVGVMDMLRFHKFTIGHAWITDFGCADKKEDFEYLFKYSPLHNVRVPVLCQYPATLLITGDHDDRVVPLHSFKLIATLQHTLGDCEKQTNPLIIRIETKAGHGAGKPTAKIIEELVDKYAFMAIHLGIDWTE